MYIPQVSGRNSVGFSAKHLLAAAWILIPPFDHAGDAVVVNPEISSGLPIASINRYPQPASRPEKYTSPATKGAPCVRTALGNNV